MDKLIDELARLIAVKVCEELQQKEEQRKEIEVQKPQFLSTKEAAEYYGKHINTIRKWIKEGSVPYKRISNTYYLIINQNDYEKRK